MSDINFLQYLWSSFVHDYCIKFLPIIGHSVVLWHSRYIFSYLSVVFIISFRLFLLLLQLNYVL